MPFPPKAKPIGIPLAGRGTGFLLGTEMLPVQKPLDSSGGSVASFGKFVKQRVSVASVGEKPIGPIVPILSTPSGILTDYNDCSEANCLRASQQSIFT